MKINAVSKKQSFGALMLEKKKATNQQKLIINNIKKTILENKYNVHLLEHKYTDVYISPNSDGKSVDLKLLSAAGYTYNYIPKDDMGNELKIKLHIPVKDSQKWKETRIADNIKIRTNKFIFNGLNALCSLVENPENIIIRNRLENISMTDRESSNLQREDILPDAIKIYGDQMVTTRDFLKHNK